jgi:hypothetical protein
MELFEEKKQHGIALQEEARRYKQEIALKTELISDTSLTIGQLKEEIAALEQKIVCSPDKIRAATKIKEKELETKRFEKRRVEKEYMEVLRSVETAEEAVKELKPSLESFSETFTQIETLRENCVQVEGLKELQRAKHKKQEQLERVAKLEEANASSLREQLGKSQFQHQVKMRPLLELNQGIKRQLEEKKSASSQTKDEEKLMDEEQTILRQLQDIRSQRKAEKENLDVFRTQSKQAMAAFARQLRESLNTVSAQKQGALEEEAD